MSELTTETLMISALAVMRDIRRAETEIATLDPEDTEAWELGEDVMRMTRVLGELQDAYRAAPGDGYPNWDDLVTMGAQD